jgi:hypothetical protein
VAKPAMRSNIRGLPDIQDEDPESSVGDCGAWMVSLQILLRDT